MEKHMICVDTSVLIDYYRKKDKSKSLFYALAEEYNSFAVSAITAYEIYVGSNTEQDKYWNSFFAHILVLPFDSRVNKVAVEIYRKLKAHNKIIDPPDIFIAASAIINKMKLATLNIKHFNRIAGLDIIKIHGG